ncbi:serine hydrolase domain-containing protein [Paenibacillus ginsengarvi]|uniref:Class C beta-lactamase-related serine hydrolase n=1 Tax=Paenibacillus ginsengarvi TaxID=400777 RepID=A0A3B0CJ62_9BACL|nr:serine hydrolase [Paenibacillus ginsengarvi]RKN84016.1 class C beta-lactamase-related serine hydrolase [Paenibacillus ginsengarvi]
MELKSDVEGRVRVSPASLLAFLDGLEQLELEVNSLILLQNGQTVMEFWRTPYRQDCPQQLYSLSKSFTSIAVGIAWDRGLLRLDDPVVSFFPDKLPNTVSPNLTRMTVHHLLSMNAGHRDNIYAQVVKERDWVRAFLAQEVDARPGSFYRYSTPATYMLSAIVQRVTGQTMADFLVPVLWKPLGIPQPSWETCPMGVTAGGMGLSLTTGSIAKFGLMMLGNGMYEGKRIVSEAYIEAATAEQSDNRAGEHRADSAQGYGYQWFRCREGCYRGGGSFGQLLFVAPEHRIVLAATASFPKMDRLQTLLDLVYEHLLSPTGGGETASDSLEAAGELRGRLAGLSCPVPAVRPVPASLPFTDRAMYRMDANPQGLQTVAFHMKGGRLELRLAYGDERDGSLQLDFAEPVRGRQVFYKDLLLHEQEVVTYASWLDDSTLQLVIYYIETPYRVTYAIHFCEAAIDLRFRINVSLGIPEYDAAGYPGRAGEKHDVE